MRAARYARVSTHDQQTLGLQVEAMRAYIKDRSWDLLTWVEDVGPGAKERPGREGLLKAARRHEVDVVVVWRLDRWGRSVADLMTTLRELNELGVGFVSLTEALDLATPTGQVMAGLLAIFAEFEREILRERVRAGIAQARREGRAHGRPRTDGAGPAYAEVARASSSAFIGSYVVLTDRCSEAVAVTRADNGPSLESGSPVRLFSARLRYEG
ncbi:Resolvase, N terminal domain [Singulisphaera sp. GP187]|uniref:recombinase family protein n=1 Tax=Singulisphaera sp. GP187 TaxID=1882752 RepID=UPI000928662A|nr:recombinase family protein [Singulisphaera sp. GP187]SIO27646.1 Resolvase, N terminal domain [Singulisphaera sp. GP187]